jgi:hypothetical protein
LDRIDYNIELTQENLQAAHNSLVDVSKAIVCHKKKKKNGFDENDYASQANRYQKQGKLMLCIYILLLACGALAVGIILKKST